MLRSATSPGWFAAATADLPALLSDHLHCERKAAENCLHLVRRYAQRPDLVERLSRLAHEETSHVVQVAALMAARGWRPQSDRPNHYARALFAEVRKGEPGHQIDTLLVAALIEARSHERLLLLAAGFAGRDEELASFYRALASAEDRHADIFTELAQGLAPAAVVGARAAALAEVEAGAIAARPAASRVH